MSQTAARQTRQLHAEDIMTRPVFCADENWTVDKLASFLFDHGISGAPVVGKDGGLVGVVSLTDVVRLEGIAEKLRSGGSARGFYAKHLDEKLSKEHIERLDAEGIAKLTVRDIMASDVVSVAPTASVGSVARLMHERRVHRVIVASPDEALGVISTMDLLPLID